MVTLGILQISGSHNAIPYKKTIEAKKVVVGGGEMLLARSNQTLFKDTSILARNYKKLFVEYYERISQ